MVSENNCSHTYDPSYYAVIYPALRSPRVNSDVNTAEAESWTRGVKNRLSEWTWHVISPSLLGKAEREPFYNLKNHIRSRILQVYNMYCVFLLLIQISKNAYMFEPIRQI